MKNAITMSLQPICLWMILAVSSSTGPGDGIRTVATGFSWAENIICHPMSQTLWVSENKRGELWRITHNDSTDTYTQEMVLSDGFRLFAGLALDPMNSSKIFAIATPEGHDCQLISVDTIQGTFEAVTTFNKECLGNGLTVLAKQNFTRVFTAFEGEFLPLAGSVVQVDISHIDSSVSVKTILDKSFADDGAWVDPARGLLYISEFVGAKVLVFNSSTASDADFIQEFDGPTSSLDDFTLSTNGSILYGADFLAGSISSFDVADHAKVDTIASGLTSPTSVRFGCTDGPGFNRNSLFVTEGGGLLSSVTDRRVLEIPLQGIGL